jgi:hypothetical protein
MSQNEPMRPHEVLGIAKGASERDVRRAYRAILFDLEDTAQTDPEYPEKKRRLEEAFQACLAQAQPGEVLVPQTSDAPAKEPLSHKKLATRFAFGLLAIAALIFGFRWFQEFAVDPGGDSAVKTSGMIAAVEVLETGSRAVVFDADGKKTPVPGSGAKDTEAVWRPDGNRLMIVGDRGAGPAADADGQIEVGSLVWPGRLARPARQWTFDLGRFRLRVRPAHWGDATVVAASARLAHRGDR